MPSLFAAIGSSVETSAALLERRVEWATRCCSTRAEMPGISGFKNLVGTRLRYQPNYAEKIETAYARLENCYLNYY